jgi:hypothetical protein
MKKPEKEEINRAYDALPQRLRNLLFAPRSATEIGDVATRHDLTEDQRGVLAEETGWVILGVVKPHEYVNRLEERMDVSHAKAISMAHMMADRVFKNEKIYIPFKK